MSKEKVHEVIVVGGGAAGLIASILIARNGVDVVLLEQNSKPGKKISVSGNGKCNITNRMIQSSRFYSDGTGFIENILSGYGYESVEKFFASVGLTLVEGSEGKMFPMSLQALSVVEILEYEAKQTGVSMEYDCRVENIEKKENLFVLNTTTGDKMCTKLLLCNGSSAAPQLGGNESGYLFARSLGHSVVEPKPSLVQLTSDQKWLTKVSGVKIRGIATLLANGETITRKEGDILFTSYGISGLAILDISREASRYFAEFAYCELSLDLFPDLSKEKLTALLLKRVQSSSKKPLKLWLQGILNKKLVEVVVRQSGCRALIEGELNRKEIGKLVYGMKNVKLPVSGTRGLQGAEVVSGGVNTCEVDAETMQSKIVENLYFAGEVLDVDGDRGGFNFHFAWISGMRAAKAITGQSGEL